jgi:hypothetical protein
MLRNVSLALVLACCAAAGPDAARGQKPGPGEKPQLKARIEVVAQEPCFTVRLYLKNEGKEDAKVVFGIRGSGLSVLPTFSVGHFQVTPPKYTTPPPRALRPNVLRVPAGKEVLYGSFTMGYPPGYPLRKEVRVVGYIRFEELKLNLETPPQMLKPLAGKQAP